MKPVILDACCGSKMFWFNKHHPSAVFMDNRQIETSLCDGRILKITPDVVADFRKIPFLIINSNWLYSIHRTLSEQVKNLG